jgi:hypothetical protein
LEIEKMTRFFEHTAAALAAVLIMTVTFVPVVTVPPADTAVTGTLLA